MEPEAIAPMVQQERQDFTEELMRGAELKRLGSDRSAGGRKAGRSMATDTE